MEDDQLVIMVRRGQQEAYRALVERYQGMVYNLVYKIVLDEDEAKDVSQETFIKAYTKLGSFRADSKFSTWLYRIAWTTAISHTRRRKPKSAVEELNRHAADSAYQADTDILSNDRSLQLHAALSQLSETDRLLLTLTYLQEEPPEEVAKILDCTQNTFKVKLFRARQRLAETLKQMVGDNVTELL